MSDSESNISEASTLQESAISNVANVQSLTCDPVSGIEPVAECRLCDCIIRGQFQHVSNLLAEIGDADNLAVFNIIKYYQSYLSSIPNPRYVPKSNLWKSHSVIQSEKRLQVLDTLQLLLKAGLDPNISTEDETALMAAVRTHDDSFILLLLKHGADPNLSANHEEMNAFALSIILNDADVVERLLHYGADINKTCCGGITPLQLSMNKCVRISRLLLQGGADIQQVLQVSSPTDVQILGGPLIHAVRSCNLYLTRVLLEHGEDVNHIYEGNTALHMAVKGDNYDMVELLVHHGADLNKLNRRGHSPIGLSLLRGGHEGNRITRLLLDSGCSRKKGTSIAVFHKSYPPIFAACFTGRSEIVKMLLFESDSDRDMNSDSTSVNTNSAKEKDSQDRGKCPVTENKLFPTQNSNSPKPVLATVGKGPLSFNTAHSKSDSSSRPDSSSRSILGSRSGLNLQTADGCTPLMMAALGGHYGLVMNLLDKGADHEVICCHGNLVHAAVSSSSPRSQDLLRLAVELGCNINLINDQGNTPLHLSARLDKPHICRYLLEQGALLNVKDRFGETALSASVYFGCNANSEILIQHGADPDLADTSGTTAMYWSIFNCREKTLRLLLNAGAKFTPEQLRNYPRNLKVMRDLDLLTFIRGHVHQPRPLISLSVSCVRKALVCQTGGRSISEAVMSLPVPHKVKDRLMLIQHV